MDVFDPRLARGESIDNERLCGIFKCGPQGGMRRSHSTKSLVLISNHVNSVYDDRWIDAIFHYTGMGLKGDQSISFMQNRTLAESPTNGVSVFLFEVDIPRQYKFQGRVRVAGTPYQESQPDQDSQARQVWVFPLALVDADGPLPITSSQFQDSQLLRRRKAKKLSDTELAQRARSAPPIPGQRQTTATSYERDPYVVEHAKRRAADRCELCEQAAPFKTKEGEAYLETHHIVWLSRGGEDSIQNTVALCPNCHRRMHALDDPTDKKRLELRVRAATRSVQTL